MWFARRMLSLVGALALAVSITFVLLRALPGDAITAQMRISGASAGSIAERRTALGLDLPPLHQYIDYWIDAARGDLGVSLSTDSP